jgi:hypothetical protein
MARSSLHLVAAHAQVRKNAKFLTPVSRAFYTYATVRCLKCARSLVQNSVLYRCSLGPERCETGGPTTPTRRTRRRATRHHPSAGYITLAQCSMPYPPGRNIAIRYSFAGFRLASRPRPVPEREVFSRFPSARLSRRFMMNKAMLARGLHFSGKQTSSSPHP